MQTQNLILLIIAPIGLVVLTAYMYLKGNAVLKIFPSKKPENTVYFEKLVEIQNPLRKPKWNERRGYFAKLNIYFTPSEIWFITNWTKAYDWNQIGLIQRINYDEIVHFQQELKEIEITFQKKDQAKQKLLFKPFDPKRVMTILEKNCA